MSDHDVEDAEARAATAAEEDWVDEAAVEKEFILEHGDAAAIGEGAQSAAAKGSAASVQMLRVALRNEKAAPELLDFAEEVVADVKRALAAKERAISGVRGTARGRALQRMVLQMDLDRVRYMLLEYLRERLRKIQKFGLFLLKSEELHSRLSESEMAFCKEFINLDAEHMQRLVLDRLPKIFRQYAEQGDNVNMVPAPDLDAFVFCRVQSDVGDVVVDDDDDPDAEPAQLNTGDLVAVRYRPVRELVESGDVVLV